MDDCVVLSPDEKAITDFIESMKMDYTLTDEGDIAAYLGIQVVTKKDSISLTQPALIQRIIETVPLKDQRMHDTPADVTLHRDKDGQAR